MYRVLEAFSLNATLIFTFNNLYYKKRNVVGGTNGDRGGLSACGLTDEIGVDKA